MTHLPHRQQWTDTLTRIVTPVLQLAAAHELRLKMPVASTGEYDRLPFVTLEAVGRVLTGLAPWLACDPLPNTERDTVARLAALSRDALTNIADPKSPDFASWDNAHGDQPLVDAAFVAHALLRAPGVLWEPLDDTAKANVLAGLRAARAIPLHCHMNNWLLFRAMTEAALFKFGDTHDPVAIGFALDHHARWYVGDGVYGDGIPFHADYYNSFVIQPMLIDILETLAGQWGPWDAMLPDVLKRAQRGAAILERMISPEGTYPPIGRSLCYRVGAFQLLSQMALRHELPAEVSPAQVRCALTAVIERQFAMPGTFTNAGFLSLGMAGDQPGLAERYISTASTYLATAGFVALGLPPDDPFWAEPDAAWTSKKVWAGEDLARDHAISK